MPFNPALHGLRGLAALAVVLFHWGQVMPAGSRWLAQWQWGPEPWMNLSLPVASGWQGVTLFFVLSGYLLASQWMQPPTRPGAVWQFWWRRARRIYPAVWAQCVVLALLGWWLGGRWAHDVGTWLLNASLWLHLPPTHTAPINGVWWTLPVELGFYLVLPAIGWLAWRLGPHLGEAALGRWRAWVVLWAVSLGVSVAWRAWVMHVHAGGPLAPHLHVIDALPGSLSSFMAGAMWAAAGTRPSAQQVRVGLWALLLVWLAWQALLWTHDAVYLSGHPLLLFWVPGLALMLSLVVHGLVCRHAAAGSAGRGLSSPVWVRMGDLSFGMYLWHYPVFLWVADVWPPTRESAGAATLGLVVVLAATWGLAELSYRWVESPWMRARSGQGLRGDGG